jgi:hypothetical protein
VPYAGWLRGDLKTRVEDVLLSKQAEGRGYFGKNEVAQLLAANSKKGNYAKEVFSLLAIELWHQEFADKTKSFSLAD